MAKPLAERVPLVLMCYANPILARGAEAVAARLAEAGVAGLIVPDLPVDEAGELRAGLRPRREWRSSRWSLRPPLRERIEQTAAAARGFVYVVSVTGVTGERSELPPGLESVVAQVREAASVPVAVGFGVATPEQVGQVGAIADGVIIGSRLVRALADAPSLEAGLAGASGFLEAAASQPPCRSLVKDWRIAGKSVMPTRATDLQTEGLRRGEDFEESEVTTHT